jgi:hypothetical protein
MTLAWDLSDDFLDAADGLEAVTLTSISGGTSAVTGALRLRISEREAAASDGRYTRRDMRWHLPAAQVTSAPQVGATVTDGSGRVWTILQVDHDTRSSRWRCWCRLLRLSTLLNDRVHIQQASWTKDDHGAVSPTWSDWKIDLPARVQPIEAEMKIEHDQRLHRVTHLVYLNESLELTHNHRLYHPAASAALHIIGYEKPERIDALFTIRAVQTPWMVG